MRTLQRFNLEVSYFLPALLFSRRWAPEGENAAYLHAWYRNAVRRRLRQKNPLVRVLLLGLWPVLTLLALVWFLVKNGPAIRRRTGRGLFAQARDQVRLAVRSGIQPARYYIYELFRPELAAGAGRYLLRFQVKPDAIYAELRRYSKAKGDNTLNDKLEFHSFCRNHGLRSAPVLGVAEAGSLRWLEAENGAPPARDLFLKPRQSRGGRGTGRWAFAGGRYSDAGGRVLDAAGLLAHIRSLSEAQPYLVQERLVNHPEVRKRNAGALSTVRVLVCWDEEGRPEVVHAYMRMSCDATKVVDNVHAGGLAAPVDIATGRLGRATDLGLSARLGWFDQHPVTGARVLDFEVPFWEETKALALRAHAALGVFCVAGWDMGILEDGPCLVEGNHGPCVDSTQRMLAKPIGNERFGRLLAFHLRRAEAGEPPPSRPAEVVSAQLAAGEASSA